MGVESGKWVNIQTHKLRIPRMSRDPIGSNKSKSTWQVLNLLDLPYIHRKLKQTLAPCWQQVAMGCFGFLWTCWRLTKLETCQLAKLVQYHQNISNIFKEQLKVGAILKAWLPTKLPSLSQERRLHSNIFNNLFFYRLRKNNVLLTK